MLFVNSRSHWGERYFPLCYVRWVYAFPIFVNICVTLESQLITHLLLWRACPESNSWNGKYLKLYQLLARRIHYMDMIQLREISHGALTIYMDHRHRRALMKGSKQQKASGHQWRPPLRFAPGRNMPFKKKKKMWPLPAAKGCRHLLNLNWGFPAGGCPPHKPWSYLANKYEHVMCNNQLFACIKALFCLTMKLKAPNLNQRKRKRPITILLCKREREISVVFKFWKKE